MSAWQNFHLHKNHEIFKQEDTKVSLRPGVKTEMNKKYKVKFPYNQNLLLLFCQTIPLKVKIRPRNIQCPGSPGNIRSSRKLIKPKFQRVPKYTKAM